MTDEKIETPEPPPVVETPSAAEQQTAPAPRSWSAAIALEAFLFKGSERFSAALVLVLSAAALAPPPPARETFAVSVPQTVLVQSMLPEPSRAPPVKFAEAKSSTMSHELARAKPVLKGRPRVTLKDKWANSKSAILLRASTDAQRTDAVSLPEVDIPILAANAPASQIESRTAKRETALANTAKPEAAAPASPLAEAQQVPANVWSEEEIKSARAACETLLKGSTAKYRILEPIKDGTCGTPAPILLQSAGKESVSFQPPLTINCDAAAALGEWIDTKVQPAAQETFGHPVTKLISASSYSCRNRYGRADAPLSEHATANAIDISGFVLANGTAVKVANSWGPTGRDEKIAEGKPQGPDASLDQVKTAPVKTSEAELLPRHPDYKRQQLAKLGAHDIAAATSKRNSKGTNIARAVAGVEPARDNRSLFLKRVHALACGIFGTVLGPEANDAHRDHLHLDMKSRRNPFCE